MANSNSVATYECLLPLSKSVGFIRGNNKRIVNGTCFHLKDGYILTCLRVVRLIVGEDTHPSLWPNIISQHVTVTFDYKQFCPLPPYWFSLEPWCDLYDGNLDYCVLKLKENANGFPPTLWGPIDHPPTTGLIYIIGHPEGQIKKIEDCTVIPGNQRSARYSEHPVGLDDICVALYDSCLRFTKRSFQSDTGCNDTLSDDTHFFSGASGSPVFTESGRLVAMHACGRFYTRAGTHSALIEYGYSMASIMRDIKNKNECFYHFLCEERNDKQESSPQDHQIEPMELA